MPKTGYSLSEIAIRRPVTTIVASLLIITAGIASLQSIPIRELPDVDSSVVTVTTRYQGASPEVIDTEITEVIESAEWQIGKSIIKVANYILGVSINDDPNIARELEEEEKIQYFLHGILDYVEISSRGEHLLVHNLINKIKEVESHPEIWINDWFDPSISAEEIIKIIEKNIEKRKNLMTWAGVSEDYLKYYDEQLGDYANFIIDTKTGEVEIEKKFYKADFDSVVDDPEYSPYIEAMLEDALVRKSQQSVDLESYEEVRAAALEIEDDLISPEG